MLLAAIILLPFYIFRKKGAPKTETEINYSKMPWWRGAIYFIGLALIFMIVLSYFVLKEERAFNFGMLGWLIIFSIFISLYSKAKKIKFKKKERTFGFYLVEEVKKEDVLTSSQVEKLPSVWSRKEGIRDIITHLPFVPRIPIGRKEFFLGYLIIMLAGVLLGMMDYFTFLGEWVGRVIIIAGGIISIPMSYVFVTWCAKRIIDIKPTTNVKKTQIILFVLFLFVGIISSVLGFLTNEFKISIIVGSIDENLFRVLKALGASVVVVLIPLLLFTLFLFFKKGARKNEHSTELDKN